MPCLLKRDHGLNGMPGLSRQIDREIGYLEGQLRIDPVFADEVGARRDLEQVQRAKEIIEARALGASMAPEDRTVLREIAQRFRRLKGFGELA